MRYITLRLILSVVTLAGSPALSAVRHGQSLHQRDVQIGGHWRRHVRSRHLRLSANPRPKHQSAASVRSAQPIAIRDPGADSGRFAYQRSLPGGAAASIGMVRVPTGPVIDRHSLGSAAAAQHDPSSKIAGAQVHIPF